MSSHPRLLGVYAHPDDETFCAGGTLAKYAAAGAEIMVYSATRGEAGQIRDAHAATRRTLGQVRLEEMRSACRQLGVQHLSAMITATEAERCPSPLVEQVVRLIRTFRPDILLTFGDDGAYGHPDHVTIGAVADEAFHWAGDPGRCPDQIAAGLLPHQPSRLFYSIFPRNRSLLLEHLVRWMKGLDQRFFGTLDYINGLLFFADESTSLGYTSDHLDVAWYPPGFHIIEQGEPPHSLYLILSGNVDVYQEDPDGTSNKVNELGTGAFFGEGGIATGQPRNAHVIARDGVTCLVFSPGAPTALGGRGEEARYMSEESQAAAMPIPATTCIDVSAYIAQKVAAIASYRTQSPSRLICSPGYHDGLMGREYFMRIEPPPEMETALV
jgi:LmbE family N-acetylglucosaminyl deacetylase